MLGTGLRKIAARHYLVRPTRPLMRRFLTSPFPAKAEQRLLIYGRADAISWSLVNPYFHYGAAFKRACGLEIRSRPVEEFLDCVPGPQADIVIVQPWFTEPPSRLQAAFEALRDAQTQARVIFLDSYAPTDLRLGKTVAPFIDRYLRKALFRDRSDFRRSFAGDTNLTEYYSTLFDIPAEPVDWQVPTDLIDRLGLVPNFLTADYLIRGFLGAPPDFTERPIDLHTRIATRGSPWYAAMRQRAKEVASGLEGIVRTPENRIDRAQFLTEMRQSKLCWSPFGYGELCWRDLEAFMTGAVLIKPCMDHLETRPDLYRAGETYLPVRWDFADFETVTRAALENPGLCRDIAMNAFQACRAYLTSQQFVTDSLQDLLPSA